MPVRRTSRWRLWAAGDRGKEGNGIAKQNKCWAQSLARSLLGHAEARLSRHTKEEWQKLEHIAEYQELLTQKRRAEKAIEYCDRWHSEHKDQD